MFTEAFPKFHDRGFFRSLRAFYRSPYYVAVIVALMAVSELFSLEMPVFYCFFALGVLGLFFTEDSACLVPIVCGAYCSFSAPNNPGSFPAGSPTPSYFTRPDAIFRLAVLIAIAAIFMIARLVLSLALHREKGVPRLWLGFAVLGLVFVLGGAFTKFYALDTVLLGIVQIASLCFFYFYFYYTIDWKNTKKDYIFMVFAIYGAGIAAETVGMYFMPGAYADGVFHREAFYTGWGVYNCVGCAMLMCVPSSFYLAAVKKHGWIYTVLGLLSYGAVVLSQSRGAMLCGAAVLLGCLVALFVYSAKRAKKGEKRELIGQIITVGGALLLCGAAAIFLREQIGKIFHSLGEIGLSGNGRIKIFKGCWEDFLSYPVLGKGYYHTWGGVYGEGGSHSFPETPAGLFIPTRAHNTILQMLASSGVIGLLGYLYHRAETLALCLRRPSEEKIFVLLSIAALFLTSYLDCHFFNFGPGLLYGILLVFAEKTSPAPLPKRKKRETAA